jgi:hypothetical protein
MPNGKGPPKPPTPLDVLAERVIGAGIAVHRVTMSGGSPLRMKTWATL